LQGGVVILQFIRSALRTSTGRPQSSGKQKKTVDVFVSQAMSSLRDKSCRNIWKMLWYHVCIVSLQTLHAPITTYLRLLQPNPYNVYASNHLNNHSCWSKRVEQRRSCCSYHFSHTNHRRSNEFWSGVYLGRRCESRSCNLVKVGVRANANKQDA